MRFCAARKQSQFKAKQTQFYLAPRFIWGLKNRFEKTKPISCFVYRMWYIVCRVLKKQSQFAGGQNEHKCLCERGL